MNTAHTVAIASDIAIWFATIAVLIFLIRYTTLAPWWDNVVGITIVALDVALELVFIPSCLLLADPHLSFFRTFWWQWVDILAIFAIAGIALWRTIAWHIIGKRGQHQRELE